MSLLFKEVFQLARKDKEEKKKYRIPDPDFYIGLGYAIMGLTILITAIFIAITLQD